MTDPVTVEQLRTRRLKDERYRALVTIETELNQMLYHLRSIRYINDRHNLQLDLPREDQLLTAMSQCARIHQLDKDKP